LSAAQASNWWEGFDSQCANSAAALGGLGLLLTVTCVSLILVTMYSIEQQLVVFFTVLGKRRKTGEDNIQEWFLVQKLCTVNA